MTTIECDSGSTGGGSFTSSFAGALGGGSADSGSAFVEWVTVEPDGGEYVAAGSTDELTAAETGADSLLACDFFTGGCPALKVTA